MDLADLYRGSLTPRRASVLAMHLPPGSATWLAAGVDAAWTTEAHLLADVVDVLAGANWQRAGGTGSKPKPLPRPSQIREEQDKQSRILARAEAFQRRQQRS